MCASDDAWMQGGRASVQQAGSMLHAPGRSRERKALAAVAVVVAVAAVSGMAVPWKRCRETPRGSSSGKDAQPSLPLWAYGAVGSFGGKKSLRERLGEAQRYCGLFPPLPLVKDSKESARGEASVGSCVLWSC
ncbi:hypothetical protein NDU88_004706 [Pleurodeles waltl]|uniref:Uncharacterized protein n=1 Tax=Pleurodeles waltl TaxID=8319 RepID=A0AAV7QGX0_PLEWA|nr:hypothetical protein NDU88_004706 [Pleurodeles waltl]